MCSQSRKKKSVCKLDKGNGETTNNEQETLDVLNEYFASGFEIEDDQNLPGLSEPEFYGDLVYKFKKIVGRVDFSDQFRKIIVRYKRIGYNINIMRQSACLVFNPITVNNFASLFNCTPVGRASDSMMAPT